MSWRDIADAGHKLITELEEKILAKQPAVMHTDLEMVTKMCHKVDYGNLEKFAAEKLGIRSLEITDSDNDTDYDFDTDTRHSQFWNQEDIDSVVERAKKGSLEIHRVGQLLSYFADAGLIPEGNYIVNVSW